MVYLFNTFGGFSFGPVRDLCDRMGIGKEEFLSEVLAAVRLDNKRGYCACGAEASVDPLFARRPGRQRRIHFSAVNRSTSSSPTARAACCARRTRTRKCAIWS